MDTKVHSTKIKILHHTKTNEQITGFNVEQIKMDKYPESKTI
jgi:hypothetical protein